MFLVKPPAGVATEPGVRDALVELIDLPATVAALTGTALNHTHFGKSLLPLIAGRPDPHRDAVFCEGGRVHGEAHCMALEAGSSTDCTGIYSCGPWPAPTA
jgi:arylsulfatase A-like enzyme